MSSAMLMLAAAKPWTYWMSVPMLAIWMGAVLAVLVSYYRKIVVPRYEWSLYEAELHRRSVKPLGRRPRRDELELDSAA